MARLGRALGPAGLLLALLLCLGSAAADEAGDPPGGQSSSPLPTTARAPRVPASLAPNRAMLPSSQPPAYQPAALPGSVRPAGVPAVAPGRGALAPAGSTRGAASGRARRASVETLAEAECDWLLAGTWVADGVFTAGRLAGQPYRVSISFRQFGSQVVGTQAEDTITYYGRCTADTLELEVWKGWEHIGQQQGSVTPDGQSIALTWTIWSPESMEGQETLVGRAQRLQR